jgi:HD superfamily phosphohydrolase
MKYLYDSVFGMHELSDLAQQFVYTYEFQRMRNMKQLGLSYYVFTSASHNRFEHSISVGGLARKIGKHLQHQHPEMVDNRFIDILQVAGLTHDIGHGPMSHTFDMFVADSPNTEMTKHENRSKEIVRYMVRKYDIDITKEEVDFICNTFDPSPEHKNNWKYQIISNTVDVDRMDYILRDSKNTGIPVILTQHQISLLISYMSIKDNEIYFSEKADKIIEDLLFSRTHLFSRVYNYKKTLEIEKMMKEVFEKVSYIDEYNLVNSLDTVTSFLKLDDSIVQRIYHDSRTEHVRELLDEIFRYR